MNIWCGTFSNYLYLNKLTLRGNKCKLNLDDMKTTRCIISLFLIINSLSIHAQQYFPFPTTNTFWQEQWGTQYQSSDYHYLVIGDTLIGLNNYIKLESAGNVYYNFNPNIPQFYNRGYVGAYRNDTLAKKVYYISKDSIDESLLYDFNLLPGDTIKGYMDQLAKDQFGTAFFAVIDSVDSVLINNSYRKRWLYHTSDNWGVIWNGGEIIEGIGSNYGLLEGLLPMFDNNGYLVCHSHNGIGIYGSNPCELITSIEQNVENMENFNVNPNPVVQGQTIEIYLFKTEDINLEVYDMLGKKQFFDLKKSRRKLTIETSSLIKGIYLFVLIENNKMVFQQKVLVLKGI